MKRFTYLGLSRDRRYCCILTCLLPIDKLDPKDLVSSDFNHRSTNWCGHDTVDRTINLEKFVLTGRELEVKTPIVFSGFDRDSGHKYPWEFKVYYLLEIKR